MAVSTVIAIYFIIWWVVLFVVLPGGLKCLLQSGVLAPGTDPGAPAAPKLWMKLVWTTVVAGVVFGILTAIYKLNLIPYDLLMRIAGPSRS